MLKDDLSDEDKKLFSDAVGGIEKYGVVRILASLIVEWTVTEERSKINRTLIHTLYAFLFIVYMLVMILSYRFRVGA